MAIVRIPLLRLLLPPTRSPTLHQKTRADAGNRPKPNVDDVPLPFQAVRWSIVDNGNRQKTSLWRKGWDSNPRGSVNPLAVFKTAALNHSATLPIRPWATKRIARTKAESRVAGRDAASA